MDSSRRLAREAHESSVKDGALAMKPCPVCQEKAEWRYQQGWGVLACAGWFAGKCEGDPVEVAPPSVGDVRPLSLGIEEDERHARWVRTRLRELWPLGHHMLQTESGLETPVQPKEADGQYRVQLVHLPTSVDYHKAFWMKPGRRQTWPGARDVHRLTNAASPPCLTAIGTPPPSSRGCVMMPSPPRWWRTAP